MVDTATYNGHMNGAAVDLNLAIEIPTIVDAGPETDERVPKSVIPASPKKSVQAPVPQHRPRTSSAKERLPIFQVLCTDADEEYADGAPYPAPLAPKVLSPSS